MAAQEQLIWKTRMAAMGEIAAAVAHEARNPLGALSNCVQLLRGNPNITGEDAELLEIVHTESQRLNEIISDFLAFGRPRPPQFEAVDVHEVVDSTLALLRRDGRCPPSIVFVTKFDPASSAVRADRDQLRQVFWNLFLNAVQAMGEQGELRVDTQSEGSAVQISVQDTGPGISPETLGRLFEPFYTTRAGGTGLGLAIVRRILEEHNGEIRVDSEPDVGACFTLTLPAAPWTT
jgi:signal transduction histidine kinase